MLSFNIGPALAAAENYYAGGGPNDELVTEIKWTDIDDVDLNIDDAEFINGSTKMLLMTSDLFGFAPEEIGMKLLLAQVEWQVGLET